MSAKGLAILGATGSIGQSTLDVVRRHPDRFRAVALTAHRQVDRLAEQCVEFNPELAVVGNAASAERLRHCLAGTACRTRVAHGTEALVEAALHPEATSVMAAIVGAAGLPPTLAAAGAGKTILLANKEALVMAGPVFMQAVDRSGAILLPIDSEHNAVFQSLPQGFRRGLQGTGVTRIVLTASGGPFRAMDPALFSQVTPEQAVAHPNWSMGRKISVDSATMMNKGLEVIEAHFLFGLAADRIDVVIHPQSIVHSMVEYADGSVIAELGNPDMRTPIAHALAYPERIASGVGQLDLVKAGRLDFMAPDPERFPCLGLSYCALRGQESMPAVLNAANEVAVEAFLKGRIRFTDIARIVEETMETTVPARLSGLDDVLAADADARRGATERLKRMEVRS